jgi:hypothetical protein
MEDSPMQSLGSPARRLAPFIAAVVMGGAGLGYAVHEHHNAQDLAAQNAQVTAQLATTHTQLDALAAKVSALAASNEAKPAMPAPVPAMTAKPRAGARRPSAQELRFKKMQSQLDAQGKEIEAARGDLASTRTELTGSIAKTHDELVVLEKKGQRSYFEFDLQKSKDFRREGPLSLSLRKANTKHQFADLAMLVDDRNLSQKHVNLYQPVMFYQPDSGLPIEIVINDISKDHIHGYVSAPKYRQSELVAASSDADAGPVQGPDQLASPSSQPPARKRLPPPSPEPNNP